MNVVLAISIPCWLIPLLVGVISAILGYLLGKFLGGGSDNNVDIDVYKNRISKLETDLAACRTSKEATSRSSGAGNTVSSLAASTASAKTGVAFDAAAAKAAFGKKIKENDLTVVEGIGPKIQELFHNHDVKTWSALANCSVEKCKDVLKSGGKRFEMHKPGTWPEQADLAAKGLWQKLKEWQDQLDGGR
ncbi:hypothetical protein [Olleya sp. YS]|uniref:hypothetical protein n=1 Tax=Olleya sp. YS TaxID=3028318 RepID=UPI0024346477|nr:hypothetical protein [Olleya sp. YS]WGD35937.1 hypothetical protein Ollyesu_05860 [Olleya sp. YS]